MKILAIDIGAGTEDILLYDDTKNSIENCIKLVLPSPTLQYAEKVKTLTQQEIDLFIKGDTIGGGSLSFAIKNHIQCNLKVYMTENAAYTLRNNLEQVKKMGIELVTNSELDGFKGEILVLEEININKLYSLLKFFGEPFSDIEYVAIAVQDHGVFPEKMSNREFRINKLKEMLERNPRPEEFAFTENEIPEYYPRMKSAVDASKRQLPNAKVIVMDTSPDAVIGCLMDPIVKNLDSILAVNVGNGHTMAAIITNGEVTGVLEHHTKLLDSKKIEKLLKDFADGKLNNNKIFEDNGHGVFYLKKPSGYSKIEKIVVTGPNRRILEGTSLDVHFATPGGDVMMSGPIGLVEATKRKMILN